MVNNMYIHTNNLNLSLFKQNKCIYLYIYNNSYSIFLKFDLKLSLDIKIISSHTISLKYVKAGVSINGGNKCLKNFLEQINSYLGVKIKFAGKGYKIKKKNDKYIILLFNRAHITHLWWKNIFLKKLKKYKIYIKYTNINTGILRTMLNIRSVNIFTKKGLRVSKQILFKKKGKK